MASSSGAVRSRCSVTRTRRDKSSLRAATSDSAMQAQLLAKQVVSQNVESTADCTGGSVEKQN
eukprot:1323692-Pleurochrysis_carterae.AAC.1